MQKILMILTYSAFWIGLVACSAMAEETAHRRTISEEAARTISAQMYSDILSVACLNGFRYSRDDIRNGFRRHFEEMRLALIDQGYTIVPEAADEPTVVSSQISFDANRRLGLSRQFGCFRAYWFDE